MLLILHSLGSFHFANLIIEQKGRQTVCLDLQLERKKAFPNADVRETETLFPKCQDAVKFTDKWYLELSKHKKNINLLIKYI